MSLVLVKLLHTNCCNLLFSNNFHYDYVTYVIWIPCMLFNVSVPKIVSVQYLILMNLQVTFQQQQYVKEVIRKISSNSQT